MERIVVGCNYHVKWQSNKAMRFVLGAVENGYAMLYTRKSNKCIWTKLSDLIFIETDYNIAKANRLEEREQKIAEMIDAVNSNEFEGFLNAVVCVTSFSVGGVRPPMYQLDKLSVQLSSSKKAIDTMIKLAKELKDGAND